jgi:hypothetical protein
MTDYKTQLKEWIEGEKTPLWVIVAFISYCIPVGILIMIFPLFGSMLWNQLGIDAQPSWVIIEGLRWSAYLDIFLLIWAYLVLKLEYLYPLLDTKFNPEEPLYFEIFPNDKE